MITPGKISQIAYGAYKAYCESTDDHSRLPFRALTAWEKNLMIAVVELHLSDPKSTPEDGHNLWVEMMKDEGWRYVEKEVKTFVLGRKKMVRVTLPKNVIKKIHPLLIPYKDLPEGVKMKSIIILAVVRIFDEPEEEGKKPKKEKKAKKEAVAEAPPTGPSIEPASPKEEAPAEEKKPEPTVHDKQKKLRK